MAVVQYSTVQYSTVQYSTVQYSTVQYSTVQCSTHLHANNSPNSTNYNRTTQITTNLEVNCKPLEQKEMEELEQRVEEK